MCRWCANKGGEHSHSNVYYMITPKGCVQRCFCNKIQVRGPCSEFTSIVHEVPLQTQNMLFSDRLLTSSRKRHLQLDMTKALLSGNGVRFDPSVLSPSSSSSPPPPPPPPPLKKRARNAIKLPTLKPGTGKHFTVVKKGSGFASMNEKSRKLEGDKHTPEDFLHAMQIATFNIIQ